MESTATITLSVDAEAAELFAQAAPEIKVSLAEQITAALKRSANDGSIAVSMEQLLSRAHIEAKERGMTADIANQLTRELESED